MARKLNLTIAHLYPRDMNIYGDTGNVLVLRRRLEWRGIEANLVAINPGDPLPTGVDIIVSGGGQDAGQAIVEADLQKRAKQLKAMAADGVVMLTICGTYQLFGHRFKPHEGAELKGIGIFDAETIAGPKRHIGNVRVKSEWGELVGYENHSGLTYLLNDQQPFATTIKGAGNNGKDRTEGARTRNVFGTYLHGPILPKNPHFADALLALALERKYGEAKLAKLDDHVAHQAALVAKARPR